MLKKIFIGDNNQTRKRPNLYQYTHLRGYHACRPEDILTYYNYGILALTDEEKQQSAMKLFNKKLDEISYDNHRCSFPQESQVYFAVFKKELIKEAGHYLCYGSEHFAGIAAHLDRGIIGRYHDMLWTTGIPTIFICDVPINIIPEYLIDDINKNYDTDNENCSFWINQALPIECIIGHEHPRKIFDPLRRYVRINEQTSCPLCDTRT